MATAVQARGRNGHLLGACHMPDSRYFVFMISFGPNRECGRDEKIPANVDIYVCMCVCVLLCVHICGY